jgi:hypothetical protein
MPAVGQAPLELVNRGTRSAKTFMKLSVHRMVIGLAVKGDHWPNDDNTNALIFLDTFRRKRDAETLAASLPNAKAHGYLYGKYDRGWSVLVTGTPEQAEQIRTGAAASYRSMKHLLTTLLRDLRELLLMLA